MKEFQKTGFEMPVDDCLQAADYPNLGMTGVILTGIVEQGAISTGATIRIIGEDGRVIVTATLSAILDQQQMMGMNPQPRTHDSAPPPYEVGLVLGDPILAKHISPGACTVIA